MEEIWKDIDGYIGLYQVSNLGNVKSLNFGRTKKEKLLSIGKTGKGYCAVSLCKNGNQKTALVHRLVANAFIPNPQNLPQINHKNEIKSDNSADNLEWCDCKYNNNYGERNKKAGKNIGKPVVCIETNIKYQSADAAHRENPNICSASIRRCCKGKRKTAGRYHWKYAGE